MDTITASDFKATCLDVLDRVSNGSIDAVAITKRGRVVGVLHPPAPTTSPFGRMRDTVLIAPGVDLTEPVATSFDAEQGVLHR